ncbi:MFS transporter [Halobacillus fulvus]|nr:MFS transporter [Halobacillus fulvus]
MMATNEAVIQKEIQKEAASSLFKNKNFVLLWGAALLSSFGISFFLFSQSWYIVNVLGLEASLGLLYIASSVPRLIFMVISGTVADRFSKTKIMYLSDMIRGLLLIGLIVWFIAGGVTLWTFVTFALFFGILDAFFWAAEAAIVPSIVSKQQLTRGNSVIQMTNQTSFILAPMLAGLLIAFGNYIIVFSVTAGMLIVASVLISFMKVGKVDEGITNTKGFWETFKEGVLYVKSSRVLTLVILTSIFLNLFLVGPVTMGLPLFVKHILNGSAVDFSILEAGLAGGMLMGAVIIGVLNVKKKRGLFSLVSLLIGGGAFIGLSFSDSLWEAVLMLALYGLSLSGCNIPIIAAIQSVVDERVLGRAMGFISLASMGLVPVSFAVTSGILSLGVSIDHIMLGGAVLVVIYALFVLLTFKELRELD